MVVVFGRGEDAMWHKILFQGVAEPALPDIQRTSVPTWETGVRCSSPPQFIPSSLPLQPQIAPAVARQEARPSRLILVIDDSPTVRIVLETTLGREGFVVQSFPDGVEAMKWLVSPHGRTPDLIFLDVELPKMDGYEIARRLKKKPPFSKTVIIFLSRRDGTLDRLKGRLAGAKGYITKPFETQMIITTVKSYLNVSTMS
jgi:twitching motility two-component system response regulator PilG